LAHRTNAIKVVGEQESYEMSAHLSTDRAPVEAADPAPESAACPFTGKPYHQAASSVRPVPEAKTQTAARVARHGWLDMTLTAITKGWCPEDGGVAAKVKGSRFSRFKIGLRHYVSISDPAAFDHVFVKHMENFPKGPDYEPLLGILGMGLFTDDGESWAKHRDLLNPLFHKKYVNGLLEKMIEPIEAELEQLDEKLTGQEVDMVRLMTNVTVEVVGNALLSQSFLKRLPPDFSERMSLGLHYAGVLSRAFMLVDPPKWASRLGWRILHSDFPLPYKLGEFQKLQRQFHQIVRTIIDDRRKNPTDEYDVLNLMLRASDMEGLLTPERLQAEGITLMLAGHETTAGSLMWTWYLLARHPEARKRLLEEVDSVLEGRRPAFDDIPKLQWTLACFEEAMRLYPPVWGVTRHTLKDDVIDGHGVKAGTTILALYWHAHMDPRWWPEPERFDPTRFMPGAPKRPSLAYLPFSAGRRTCIARSFALQEALLVLAMYSQRYTFDLAPGCVVEPESGFTLRTKDKIRMHARRRTTKTTVGIRSELNGAEGVV